MTPQCVHLLPFMSLSVWIWEPSAILCTPWSSECLSSQPRDPHVHFCSLFIPQIIFCADLEPATALCPGTFLWGAVSGHFPFWSYGLIWCQGTFRLLGKCIAPSSGAVEQGQQECKGRQDVSLLTNFVW